MVFTKTKSPEIQTIRILGDKRGEARVTAKIRQIWRAMSTGICYPCRDWRCRECGYQTACAEWPEAAAGNYSA